jgi:hypothetical protein
LLKVIVKEEEKVKKKKSRLTLATNLNFFQNAAGGLNAYNWDIRVTRVLF